MKITLVNSVLKKLFMSVLFIGVMVTLQSCSKKVQFETSPAIPEARGDVKISKNSNKNYVIKPVGCNL